jgi:hypothetical protein
MMTHERQNAAYHHYTHSHCDAQKKSDTQSEENGSRMSFSHQRKTFGCSDVEMASGPSQKAFLLFATVGTCSVVQYSTPSSSQTFFHLIKFVICDLASPSTRRRSCWLRD